MKRKDAEETGRENFEIVIENVETSEVKCFEPGVHDGDGSSTLFEKNTDSNEIGDFFLGKLFKDDQVNHNGNSGLGNKNKSFDSFCVGTNVENVFDFSGDGAANSHPSRNGLKTPGRQIESGLDCYEKDSILGIDGRRNIGCCKVENTELDDTESSLWYLATGYDFLDPLNGKITTGPDSTNLCKISDFSNDGITFDTVDKGIKKESIRAIKEEENLSTNHLSNDTSKSAASEVALRDSDCNEQINKSPISKDRINICSNVIGSLNDTLNAESDSIKLNVSALFTSPKRYNLASYAKEKNAINKIDRTSYVKNDHVVDGLQDVRKNKPALCSVKRYSYPYLSRSSTFPNLTYAICNEAKCHPDLKNHTQSSSSHLLLSSVCDAVTTMGLSIDDGKNEKSAGSCDGDKNEDHPLWKTLEVSTVPVSNTLMTASKIKFSLKRQQSTQSFVKHLKENKEKDLENTTFEDDKNRNGREKVRNSVSKLATRQRSVNTDSKDDDEIVDRRCSQKDKTPTWQLCYEKNAIESKEDVSVLDDSLSISNLKIDEAQCKLGESGEIKESNEDIDGVDYHYVMLDGIMSLSLSGCGLSELDRNMQLKQDANCKENKTLTKCRDHVEGKHADHVEGKHADHVEGKHACSYSSAPGHSVNMTGDEIGSRSLNALNIETSKEKANFLNVAENVQDELLKERRTGCDVNVNEAGKICNTRVKVQNNVEAQDRLHCEIHNTKDSKQNFEPFDSLENPNRSFGSDSIEYNATSVDSKNTASNLVKETCNDNNTFLKMDNRFEIKSEPSNANVNSLINVEADSVANESVEIQLKEMKLGLPCQNLESVRNTEAEHFSNYVISARRNECENDCGENNDSYNCDSYRIIKKYFMDRCTGSTLQNLVLRVKERKTYTDHELDDDEIEGKRSYKIEDKLKSDRYNKDYVKKLVGEEFNLRYLQENGLQYPILFAEKNGLGLRVPSDNFKVADVKSCVGSRRMLDVMDVTTQKGLEMTMKEWTRYYENTDRDRLLNVISLEFSHTKLENYVESPNLVREIDWVDTAWPQHLKDCQTESTNAIDKMKYPKVQKYCLMSVAGCYTDFHIDFGGTSVWYHILHGEKIFWLIPPTDRNLAKYENWVLSGKQGDAFLADSIEECQMIRLVAGNTFIIPSGWIHAVFTPKDSLVFGGNFLHSFNMVNQLRVAAIEDKTHVPMKFRYPFYAEINWYVLERYVHSLTGVTYLEKPQLNEDLEVITTKVERDQTSFEMLEEKLNKRLSVSLTRIDDTSPRRKSTSDDDSTASGPTRSPGQASTLLRTGRKSSSESANSFELKSSEKPETIKVPYKSPVKKKTKYVHLTKYELEGLIEVVGWVESLPSSKKGIPKDLIDAEAVLREVKRLIQEHMKDNPELAITGEPVLEWTKATKKLIKLKQKAKTAKLLGTHCGPKVKTSGGKNASGNRHRRVRCKKCEPCTRDDCMECNFCKDMRKYGGPGRAKQSCISRQCLAPILPKGIMCQICKLYQCMHDKPVKTDGAVDDDAEDYSSSLMECGICWEIVHPLCLRKKYENLNNDGILNEDLPNSWKCSKCCFDGKEGKLMARVFKGGWRPNPTSTPPPLSISPPPQPHSPGVIVTEGKRVTLIPVPVVDSKKMVMPKLSPSPEHREIDSKPSVLGIADAEQTSTDIQSMTPPQLKTELPDTVKTNGMKMDVADTLPVISHDIKMEVTDPFPVKKIEEPVKSYSKRSSSPLEGNPVKKKRNVSPSPSRSSKSSRSSGHTKTTPSTSSKSGKVASVELATKRSKREMTQRSATRCTFDFDDEEFMDISVPMPDKGKGKGVKGRKNLHLKNKDFGTNLGLDMHSKSRTQTVEQKSEEQGHLLKKSSEKLCSNQLKQTLIAHIERRNLPIIKPRFVVRPAPISPPDDYCLMLNGQKHPLSRKLWTRIFTYLQSADLARCQAVCQTWNRWCINPDLWKKIDLSKRRIVQTHLMGIVRRQPEYLDLSAVIMTQKQILWLLERIPLLKTLLVSKCSWATISGLCMSACPLLNKLDVSWATGLNDKCFEDLISPPVDRKPGVKNISRLHRLKSIHLSGTEITDTSLELMTLHLSQLEELNVSYCTRITDRGIQILASSKSATQDSLKRLNISGCRGLTEISLDAIKNFSKLKELYAVNCIRIPVERCRSLRHPRLHTFRF